MGSSSGMLTGDTSSAETTLLVTGEGSGGSSTGSSSGLDSTDSTDSSSSSASSATTGDQESSLLLYTRYLEGSTWSSVDLDDVWTGPSAPPTDGILATVRLTHFSRFLVFSDDGYTYQQADGTWADPVPTVDLFPIVGDRVIDAVSHLPARDNPTIETLFIVAEDYVTMYQMYESGGVSFVEDIELTDVPGGPPRRSGLLEWGFTITNLADPSANWVRWYQMYDDHRIYLANGTGGWVDQWPVLSNEFFMGVQDEPDPLQAVATWHDDASGRLHVIAP